MLEKIDKTLFFSSEVASSIGLDEAILLQILRDNSLFGSEVESDNLKWKTTDLNKLSGICTFWTNDDIYRIFFNLHQIGIIATSGDPKLDGKFLYMLNESRSVVKQVDTVNNINLENQSHNTPALPINRDWIHDDETFRQLEQLGVAKDFANQQVPQFVSYWRERNISRHGWSSKFIKEVWRQWQKNKSIENARRKEFEINSQWKPSLEVYDILSVKGGISRNFIEDSIPEFVLYWRGRGDKSNTWDSKFVQHVKRQWNFYSGLMKNDNDPTKITEDWRPKNAVYDVLAMANINREFAEDSIKEFIIYWQENGNPQMSWSTKFLQYVKRRWAFNINPKTGQKNVKRQNPENRIRNRSIVEALADRSWAS